MTKENKELTTQQGLGAFAAFKSVGADKEGFDLDASDAKLPKIKILQSTSQEVAKSGGKLRAGQFYNTVTCEATDTIDCILLDQGKSMIMWPESFKRGEDPLCRSIDGKTKTEGCGDGNCETCQYSSQNPQAWRNLKDGKTKPPCNKSYVWLAIDCKTKMPFRIIASGASVAPTKDFLNKLIMLNVEPFACKVTLATAQKENDKGLFYVLDYTNLRENDEALNSDGSLNLDAYEGFRKQRETYKELFMIHFADGDTVSESGVAQQEGSSSNDTSADFF